MPFSNTTLALGGNSGIENLSNVQRRNLDGEEESEEGGEAQTKRRLHEADDPDRPSRGRGGLERHAAYRSHQEDLGLYQAQWPARQEEQAHDQLRREAEASLWWQEPGLDVRDDEAG